MSTIAAKIAQFSSDVDIAHAIIHGPATGAGSLVTTEGGQVRTLARAVTEGGATAAEVAALQDALASLKTTDLTDWETATAGFGAGGGSGGAAFVTPDSPAASPTAWDDHFQLNSVDTAGARHTGALAWDSGAGIAAMPGGIVGALGISGVRRMYLPLDGVVGTWAAKVFNGVTNGFVGLSVLASTGICADFGPYMQRGTDDMSTAPLRWAWRNATSGGTVADGWLTGDSARPEHGAIYIAVKVKLDGVELLRSQAGLPGTYFRCVTLGFGNGGFDDAHKVGLFIDANTVDGAEGCSGGALWFKKIA